MPPMPPYLMKSGLSRPRHQSGRSSRMANASGSKPFRPWLGVVSLVGGVALVLAGGPLSGQSRNMVNLSASADTITCPNVADKLPDIPAQAQAEVDRNLKLLQT